MPASKLTPAQRRIRAQIAAHTRAALYDGREVTQAARDAFEQRFLDLVDPDGTLRRDNPREAERRAQSARTAHMRRLAFLSVKKRSKDRRNRPDLTIAPVPRGTVTPTREEA